VSYDIYVQVDSDNSNLSTSGGEPGTWGGTANLGSDDRIILVGDDSDVLRIGAVDQVSVAATQVAWQASVIDLNAAVVQGQSITRLQGFTSGVQTQLFNTALPTTFLTGQEGVLNTMYRTNMPGGILTSQGLV
jgi:hypothetical protein